MKRGTPRHPKVMALASKLGVRRYCAVGVLEMLWHFTAEFALDGNIGKHSDEVIGDALNWDGDSTILVQALIDTGWIDECECHGRRVHDWHNHADQTVQRVLAKRNQEFVPCYLDPSTKLAPSKMPLPSPLPKANTEGSTRVGTSKDEEETDMNKRHPNEMTPDHPKWREAAPEFKTEIQGEFTDPEEEWPLQSPEANAVLAKIRKYWPEYPLESARVCAAKLHGMYWDKLDLLAVIDTAWAGWDAGRTIYDKGGLQACLNSWCNTEIKNAQKTSQAPSRGSAPPHQSEPSRPRIWTRLNHLEDSIQLKRQIDPHAMVADWNESVLDGVTRGNSFSTSAHHIIVLIEELARVGKVELGLDRKIIDHSLPSEPRTPIELLEGDEAPDVDFVAAQLAKLKGL